MFFPDNSEEAHLRHCGDAFPRPPELNAREPEKTLFPVSPKNIKQVQSEGGFIGMNLYGNYRLVYSIVGFVGDWMSVSVPAYVYVLGCVSVLCVVQPLPNSPNQPALAAEAA
jgi:hypothetical protein